MNFGVGLAFSFLDCSTGDRAPRKPENENTDKVELNVSPIGLFGWKKGWDNLKIWGRDGLEASTPMYLLSNYTWIASSLWFKMPI